VNNAPTNLDIADRLDEVGRLMGQQNGHRFRVRAYHRAAATVRALPHPIDDLFAEGGLEALEALPGVGESLARSIAQVLVMGRLPMLDRLRGESEPVRLFQSVPGIGSVLARRIHEELGVETLEELEVAAHDGRLERMGGIGVKRLTGIRDSLAHRLVRIRRFPPRGMTQEPDVAELLDVDREYRWKVATDDLPRISPRRFNPRGEAWLPILHTRRASRSYTVLWSNTARAHELGKTADWAILYVDGKGGERQYTVITSQFGPLRGRRIVRGRERECLAVYESRDDGGSTGQLLARVRNSSREPL
jgi:putative hydrolase